MMMDPRELRRGFGSDNHAGAHPAIIEAIAAANTGHAPAYGDDPWTARATQILQDHFGADADVAFVFNGTGANIVCLGALCNPWESVICAETAHINVDECGAPERVAGVKLVAVATPNGKLTPDSVRPHLTGFGFQHHAQPRVISISQASEYGTVYTPEEIRALADLAHEHSMFLHVDGARLSNAAVYLDCGLADITGDAGVDMLSLGGTKNGMLAGEAVVLFGEARRSHLPYVRKQSCQLSSKMRFASAQFIAMFGTDLWRECASNANAMAGRLATGVRDLGIEPTQPVEANEVFAVLPPQIIPELSEEFRFYTWDEQRSEVRWVTSWDTREEDVDALLGRLSDLLGRSISE